MVQISDSHCITDGESQPCTINFFPLYCNVNAFQVKEMNPNAVVDYKNPDLSIMVDIIKDITCCSVVPKFYQYRKYNLGELANFHNKLKEAAATADNDTTENGKSAVATVDKSEETIPNSDSKGEENGTNLETITENIDTGTKTDEIDTEKVDTEPKTDENEKDTGAAMIETEVKTEKIDTETKTKADELTTEADTEKKENGEHVALEKKEETVETVVQ